MPGADADDNGGGEYIARIQAYMAKALKEAKVNTSWIQPNEAWDSAHERISSRKFWIFRRSNHFLPSFVSGR